MRRFEDKVALVTGATSGIGRATAVAFAAEGSKVVFTGRREPEGRETLAMVHDAGGEGTFVQGDVSREEDVERTIEQALDTYGTIDVAFNNAGRLGRVIPFATHSVDDFDETMAVNVRGIFLFMRGELAVMQERGHGVIVNNSSLAGVVGIRENAIYTASKHAVMGLTRAAALEVATAGIRVNAICASSVEGAIGDHFSAEQGLSEEDNANWNPIGRTCQPDEVARVVLFLCSDDAGYVTGGGIPVDGGYSAG